MPLTTSTPRLAYGLTAPVAGATPLVCVSGMGGVMAAWLMAARYFSPSRQVLTYDHRWMGGGAGLDTEWVPQEGMTMRGYAEDLVRLLDELGIGVADFVGLSFGGRVLQELALGYPERVRKLVLGGTSAGGRGHVPGEEAAIRAMRHGPELTEAEWLNVVIPAMFGEKYRKSEVNKMENLARWWKRHPPDALGLMQQGRAYDRFDVADRIAHLNKPVLVLHGTDDRLSPGSNAMFLLQNLPDARLVWLQEVGHSPNVEAPTQFHAEIERFLDE